jgi:hypothetical protein
MLAGSLALAAPVVSLLAAFGGVLSWPAWAGIVLVCTAVGGTMSYYRLPPRGDGRSIVTPDEP